jgi:hypothetical protein
MFKGSRYNLTTNKLLSFYELTSSISKGAAKLDALSSLDRKAVLNLSSPECLSALRLLALLGSTVGTQTEIQSDAQFSTHSFDA